MTDIDIDAAGKATVVGAAVVPSTVTTAHRIAPLVVLLVYGAVFVWHVVYTTLWYTHLPDVQRSVNVTAYIGGTQTVLAGLAAFIFKFYSGGRDGDQH